MRFALLLLLLAPEGTQWSKAHGIGIRPPDTWKIVERDKEARAFVIEGPELGPGTPRAVVWNLGPAAITLDKRADELAKAQKKREGFRIVARKRKVIGPYAAVRLGFEIGLSGGRDARGRFTLMLMGDRFVVFEMSAAASHYPGKTFDQMEKTLAIKWVERKAGNLRFDTPIDWTYSAAGSVAKVVGPSLGVAPTVVRILEGRAPAAMLEGAEPGPPIKFLGKSRKTDVVERVVEKDLKVRMLHVFADGATAAVMAPVSIWEDVAPTFETVVKSVRRAE